MMSHVHCCQQPQRRRRRDPFASGSIFLLLLLLLLSSSSIVFIRADTDDDDDDAGSAVTVILVNDSGSYIHVYFEYDGTLIPLGDEHTLPNEVTRYNSFLHQELIIQEIKEDGDDQFEEDKTDCNPKYESDCPRMAILKVMETTDRTSK